jgi:tRNA(Arg) A34 adenosine deaminase TadA
MLSRRSLLGKVGVGLGVGFAAVVAGVGRVLGADRRSFAARAAAMRDRAIASGDQAYGAVVVKDGRIVGLGPSRVVINTDPTGHAEMEALRDAARNLGTHDLTGCDMFTTSPPCRMCETAAYWANIRRVYTGPDAGDRGKPGYGC